MWILRLKNSIKQIKLRLQDSQLNPHIRHRLEQTLKRLEKELEELES